MLTKSDIDEMARRGDFSSLLVLNGLNNGADDGIDDDNMGGDSSMDGNEGSNGDMDNSGVDDNCGVDNGGNIGDHPP
jgi:hypothetical protein